MVQCDYEHYVEIAVEAAVMGGRAIMSIYGQNDVGIRLKEDQSPVTAADMASHRVIMEQLAKTGIPVLSEEGAPIPFEERCGWPLLWIVDPLDGTKEFIARNGEFTVNIALVENHRVVLGIIFVPVLCCLYVGFESTARKYVVPGWLQQRDDHFLRNSTFVELPSRKDKPLTAVDSISHPNEAGKHYISRVRQLTGAIDVCSVGSSLKFCLLAEGEAHLYPRYGHIMEWDTAAGQAIVEASGGSVLTLPGMEPMFYNREDLRNPHFIAIGAGVERQLVAVAAQ